MIRGLSEVGFVVCVLSVGILDRLLSHGLVYVGQAWYHGPNDCVY